MSVFLMKGPYIGKDGRRYCICEIDGKRRKTSYARYSLMKSGVEVKDYHQVHHKDGNKLNDSPSNLMPLRPFRHKEKHERNIKWVRRNSSEFNL